MSLCYCWIFSKYRCVYSEVNIGKDRKVLSSDEPEPQALEARLAQRRATGPQHDALPVGGDDGIVPRH